MRILPLKLTRGAGDPSQQRTSRPFPPRSRFQEQNDTGTTQQSVTPTGLTPGHHGMTVSMVPCPQGTKGLKNTLRLPSSLAELPTAQEGKTFYKCAEREGE